MYCLNLWPFRMLVYWVPKILRKACVIAFTIDDVHPHDVATILDSYGVCIRSGHHCAQPLGAYYKVPASNRMSMYVYTRKEDLDIFLDAVKKVRPTMGFED